MPREPRFRTPRTQSLAVAAIMFGLFGLSLALALGLTLRRAHAATPLVPQPVGALTLQLPSSWKATGTLTLATGLTAQRYTDAARPTRVLHVIRVQTPSPTSGDSVLSAVLPTLWPAGLQENLRSAGAFRSVRPPYAVVEWIGASRTAATGDILHMAADLTRDNQVHWLLYLTDRVQAGDDAIAILQTNQGLLRSVVYLAEIKPTS